LKTLSKFTPTAFIAAALFLSINVKAQTTPVNALRFNIGFEIGDPTGVARIGTNFIIGGTLRFQYGITNNLAATITGGAYHFHTKYIPGSTTQRYDSYGNIPLRAGLKYFFIPNIYIAGEAGASREILDSGWGPTRLDLSPAIGYGNKHWDVGIHYDSLTRSEDSYGLLALRLAYGFGK
jgi:hypothetical protein